MKLKLHGFNNLTKTLTFNIYDVCYANTPEERDEYIKYIDEQYNSDRLTHILTTLAIMIGANVLGVSKQDYLPYGASVTMLVSEGPIEPHTDQVLAHLDKSHICVHTYPETDSRSGVSTFRADIDVSTCGMISPLVALDYLIQSFESDIVMIDYKVRGFTRCEHGDKHFMDHHISSIQQFISPAIRTKYRKSDMNLTERNIWSTRMMLKSFVLEDYLFTDDAQNMSLSDMMTVKSVLKKEMKEIYHSTNLTEE